MNPLQQQLAKRRKELGIPYAALAARSGVSVATAKRILSGQLGNASFDHVAAIARAMGLALGLVEESSATDYREEAARQQARRLVRMVQGTAGLEAQAVDAKAAKKMERESVHRLMAGSPRRVWAS
jgi:transcriptional regulator with XRE-family HTH domain